MRSEYGQGVARKINDLAGYPLLYVYKRKGETSVDPGALIRFKLFKRD